MARGWSEERRKRQSMLIHIWNPSSKATGPKTAVGKARSSINAFKHGGRTKYMKEKLDFLKRLHRQQKELLNK